MAGQYAFSQDASAISEEVKSLGRGKNDFRVVQELAQEPELATKSLIDELHPIQETRILNGENDIEAEHILWCLRALRYVTGGKDFCAKTSYKFGGSEEGKNREYWIYFKNKKCATFFAMWPARGTEYIAPQDAQAAIIQQWKNWFAREGAEFHYQPMENPSPEDWLW